MAAIGRELGLEEERLAGIRVVVAEELGRGLFGSKNERRRA
jgi:hypothetical protein